MTSVALKEIPRANISPTDLIDTIRNLAPSAGPGRYLYVERLDQVTLLEVPGDLPEELMNGSWEGRLFDREREVRWKLHEALEVYTVTVLEESVGGTVTEGITENLVVDEWRYYLRGEVPVQGRRGSGRETPRLDWDAEGRLQFYDGSVSARLAYPVSREKNPRARDRAYLQVRRYRRERPETWPSDAGSLQEVFNQPLLLAHRCVGVGCGRDEEGSHDQA